jgi:sugar lactone lactonase YvrE
MVENLAVMKYGKLIYYNGKKSLVVDSGLFLPNGVNMSPDGRYLYMTNMITQLRVYDIQQDHKVKLVQEVNIETGLDNINIDPKTGDLWIGCHPVGHKMMAYIVNHDNSTSPSQVIRIRTNKGLITDRVEEVFVDDGQMISASASVIYHMGGLLIGSVCHSAVYCQVKHLEK